MNRYLVLTGDGDPYEIEALTTYSAARQAIEAESEEADTRPGIGQWSDLWRVHVAFADDADDPDAWECVWVILDADTPACVDGAQIHDWGPQSDWGHGPGLISSQRCRDCGIVRESDTWHEAGDGSRIRAIRYLVAEEASTD